MKRKDMTSASASRKPGPSANGKSARNGNGNNHGRARAKATAPVAAPVAATDGDGDVLLKGQPPIETYLADDGDIEPGIARRARNGGGAGAARPGGRIAEHADDELD